jgi:hypothetical protein
MYKQQILILEYPENLSQKKKKKNCGLFRKTLVVLVISHFTGLGQWLTPCRKITCLINRNYLIILAQQLPKSTCIMQKT